MRQAADLPKNIVKARRRKEIKRKKKRDEMEKVSGKGLQTAGSLKQTWTGLKPRKIEGFVLYLRGVPITAKNWPYKTKLFGDRIRMV